MESTTSHLADAVENTGKNPDCGRPLVVATYNMLEQGLAFGAIPWVMIVPASLRGLASNFDEVKGQLSREYVMHWHKNAAAGDHRRFRRLFGEHLPFSPGDGDGGTGEVGWDPVMLGDYDLPGVTLVSEDQVEVGGRTCTTLRGLLRRNLRARVGDDPPVASAADTALDAPTSSPSSPSSPSSIPLQALSSSSLAHPAGHPNSLALADDIFAHIARANEEVFAWPKRGRRIFQLITNGGSPASETAAAAAAAAAAPRVTSRGGEDDLEDDRADGNGRGGDIGGGDALGALLDRFYGGGAAAGLQTSHLPSPPPLFLARGTGPDVIVLQEYDAHFATTACPPLDYFGADSDGADSEGEDGDNDAQGEKKEEKRGGEGAAVATSFGEAMRLAGYHSILFQGPKRDGCGIGVFAKASRLRIAFDREEKKKVEAEEEGPVNLVVSCGEWSPREQRQQRKQGEKGCALLGAFDFFEECHPVPPRSASSFPKSFAAAAAAAAARAAVTPLTATGAPLPAVEAPEPLSASSPPAFPAVPVRLEDRKHCAAAVFELVTCGETEEGKGFREKTKKLQRLVVLGTHLMTTSRDCASKVVYPGEMRASELVKLKEVAKRFVRDDRDGLVLCGDFNINMRIPEEEEGAVAGAASASPSPSPSLTAKATATTTTLKTAKKKKKKNDRFVFEGIIPHGAQPAAFSPLWFDTGFCLAESTTTKTAAKTARMRRRKTAASTVVADEAKRKMERKEEEGGMRMSRPREINASRTGVAIGSSVVNEGGSKSGEGEGASSGVKSVATEHPDDEDGDDDDDDDRSLSARFVWQRRDGTSVALEDAYEGMSTKAREEEETSSTTTVTTHNEDDDSGGGDGEDARSHVLDPEASQPGDDGRCGCGGGSSSGNSGCVAVEKEAARRQGSGDGSRASSSSKIKSKSGDGRRRRGDGGGGALIGTSHNAARVETIDFVFLDQAHWPLGPCARSPLRTTQPDGTPDEANPSDHLPLIVALPVQ